MRSALLSGIGSLNGGLPLRLGTAGAMTGLR